MYIEIFPTLSAYLNQASVERRSIPRETAVAAFELKHFRYKMKLSLKLALFHEPFQMKGESAASSRVSERDRPYKLVQQV